MDQGECVTCCVGGVILTVVGCVTTMHPTMWRRLLGAPQRPGRRLVDPLALDRIGLTGLDLRPREQCRPPTTSSPARAGNPPVRRRLRVRLGMEFVAFDADAVEVEPKRSGRGLADAYRREQEPQDGVEPVEVARVVAGLPGWCGIRADHPV